MSSIKTLLSLLVKLLIYSFCLVNAAPYEEQDARPYSRQEDQKWAIQSNKCNLEKYVDTGVSYLFPSFPPKPQYRVGYNHRNGYGGLPPRQHYEQNYPSHMQLSYSDPKECTWKFKTYDDCELTLNINSYDRGDINCEQQYLVIGDEKSEKKICGFGKPAKYLASRGKELVLQHYQRNGYYGTASSYFSGYVSCIEYMSGDSYNYGNKTNAYGDNAYGNNTYGYGNGTYGYSSGNNTYGENYNPYDGEMSDDSNYNNTYADDSGYGNDTSSYNGTYAGNNSSDSYSGGYDARSPGAKEEYQEEYSGDTGKYPSGRYESVMDSGAGTGLIEDDNVQPRDGYEESSGSGYGAVENDNYQAREGWDGSGFSEAVVDNLQGRYEFEGSGSGYSGRDEDEIFQERYAGGSGYYPESYELRSVR